MDELEKAKQWAVNGRSVRIDVTNGTASIWAWDSNLLVGEHVNSIDGIDLSKAKEARERREYERLKAKFE